MQEEQKVEQQVQYKKDQGGRLEVTDGGAVEVSTPVHGQTED